MPGTSGSVQPARGATPSQLQQILSGLKLHKRPKVLTGLALWLFGLYAIFLSPAPVSVTPDMRQRFEKRIDLLARSEKPLHAAEQRWLGEEYSVSQAKAQNASAGSRRAKERDLQEWFWRFKPAVRSRVHERQARAVKARQEYRVLEKEAQRKYSDAKAELGLFSEAGVDEGRRLFWKAFESGKVFGRRQTFWDALMTLITSREEGIAGMVVQLIIQAMINFTTGMFASIVIFICQLPSFLWSYQPSLVGGLAFFVIAVLGALSVLASFLLALYAAGATAIYSIATISPNSRIGGGFQRRRGRNIRYHYD